MSGFTSLAVCLTLLAGSSGHRLADCWPFMNMCVWGGSGGGCVCVLERQNCLADWG